MAKWRDVSRTLTESTGVGKNVIAFVTKQVPVTSSVSSREPGLRSTGRSGRRRKRWRRRPEGPSRAGAKGGGKWTG